MNRFYCLSILAAALVASASAAAALVREIPSPAPAQSGESSLVAGPDGTTYLTFSGPGARDGERALWLATLAPGADAWSAPRPIVSTPRLMENWADFASLAMGADGQLWAQWFQTREGTDAHGYDGWFSRSRDGGATWSKPAALGHEFVSLAPLSGGRMLAVWLESTRTSGAAHGHDAPAAKKPGAPSAPSMRLKSCLLAPDGSTLQDWVVDPDVCTCCQTSLAHLGGDRVVVAYRGHTPDEIRDNRIAFFNQTIWGPPRTLNDDGWKIPACPVNGPAADARSESLAIAWFTAANGTARVQTKLSRDGGVTFGPALAVDLGRPIGRLDLVKLADGSALVSWLEAAASTNAAGLYVRRIFADGALSAPQLVAPTSAVRASGFARLARREDDSVVVTWTDAVPVDPANPKSPAATRVRTALIFPAELSVAPKPAALAPEPAVRAVVRGNELAFLEICAPASTAHTR
ncbi:MAG: exo-alpha-sialidase [Opitutae bacterium]|nr:exo-alpha-sialidase [Opitutae bacterium]